MTDVIKTILRNLYQYNPADLAYVNFGLDRSIRYDALVVAPSYSPLTLKLSEANGFRVTELGAQSYCTGYLVEQEDLKLAWIKTAAGGCNLLDYLLICGELQVGKLIFIGAAGALKESFQVGDLCTPSYSIAGTLANTYLKESLRDYVPFEKVYPDRGYVKRIVALAAKSGYALKEASVFCTDSIVMEYTHLEEIKAFGTDLIEMETSAFYAVARLMELPAIALLVVSDNSASGVPLVGRSPEQQRLYDHTRQDILPHLIATIAKA